MIIIIITILDVCMYYGGDDDCTINFSLINYISPMGVTKLELNKLPFIEIKIISTHRLIYIQQNKYIRLLLKKNLQPTISYNRCCLR